MPQFTMQLAGCAVQARCLYDSTREFCRDYLIATTAPDALCVSVGERDIARERELSARADEANGVPVQPFSDAYLETLALYRAIAEEMIDRGVLLFHGSVIAVDGEGYLFTAKSGTGKSTHTRLWRELLGSRAVMVNDDKPLLRVTPDGVFACGTPWDGKHRLSANIEVPLRAVCALSRAQENTIRTATAAQLYPLLVQQSYRPARPDRMQRVLRMLDTITKTTTLYTLGCNPTPDAARVATEAMLRR